MVLICYVQTLIWKVYQLILHPLFALTGDVQESAKMMGVGGLPRRVLRILVANEIGDARGKKEAKNL